MKIDTLESIGAAGSKTAIVGAGMTSWSWFTSNEFFGAVGALVAILGLVITWYYKREANRRLSQEAAHRARERDLRMSLMMGTGRPVQHDTDLATLEAED